MKYYVLINSLLSDTIIQTHGYNGRLYYLKLNTHKHTATMDYGKELIKIERHDVSLSPLVH